ncbi:MAG: recombination protein RecR [Clostridia bacterium]|nr:recombination protein RecR [Clostridia bacterium]MBQ2707739.1 recombination protein RecR [Clostridia bacterium]
MAEYILPLEKLIEQFRRLPGIGKKTAVRLAFSVLDFTAEEAEAFADAIRGAKEQVKTCRICQNISDGELCPVCADENRDRSVICVVEDAKAVMSLEKVREYGGVYHVLHGAISPMAGIGPDKLRIGELMARLGDDTVKEVIIATNPTVEGEATAMYLTKLIKPLGIKVSRLAYGIPVGGELEYADEVTLMRAIEGRRIM